MPSRAPTPPRSLRSPLVLLAAALAGAALAGGSLLLAERLRGADPAGAARPPGPTTGSPGAAERSPPAAAPGASVHPAAEWRCPMHPRVARSGPGACPICGMTLVKDEGGTERR